MRHDELLRLLASNDVEAVVVGMTAAVLQGVPVTTLDVDIVHRRTEQNVERLLRVLMEVHAVYRTDDRRLQPSASHLRGAGHQLLTTDHGDIDCLGEIDDGKSYEDLVQASVQIPIGDSGVLRVLNLDTLIAVKKRAGRPKDLAVIPYLEATLEERQRRGD